MITEVSSKTNLMNINEANTKNRMRQLCMLCVYKCAIAVHLEVYGYQTHFQNVSFFSLQMIIKQNFTVYYFKIIFFV